ncbi:eae-like domain protein [Enterobacter hormaechei]|uniref:eae-like domain protein n=1 Tax=Enterobacter hormaechei TaxID=158836 RepID=UPI002FF39892
MSSKYEDLIKNARMNADCGEYMSPTEVTTLLNVVEATFSALAAENAGLKAFGDKLNEMYDDLNGEGTGWQGRLEVVCQQEALGAVMEEFDAIKTPATDAFLAEVRAQGVEAAIDTAKNVVAQEFQYKDFETAQRVCCKFPESDLVGKVEMVEWLADFAAQIRKGVHS